MMRPRTGARDDTTRQELYERARRLGISGRSRMSKAQLVAAVEAAARRQAGKDDRQPER